MYKSSCLLGLFARWRAAFYLLFFFSPLKTQTTRKTRTQDHDFGEEKKYKKLSDTEGVNIVSAVKKKKKNRIIIVDTKKGRYLLYLFFFSPTNTQHAQTQ